MTAQTTASRTAPPLPPTEPGDFAPNFELFDDKGQRFALYDAAGRPIVLVFLPEAAVPQEVSRLLQTLQDALDRFAASVASVAAVARTPLGGASIPPRVRLLIDADGRTGHVYRCEATAPSILLLDAQCRIAARFGAADAPPTDAVLAQVERVLAARGAGLVRPHPPVLWIPELLEPADCRFLIAMWERQRLEGGAGTGGDDDGPDGRWGAARGRPEAGDPQTLRQIEDRIARRVIPQIMKAFSYRVTRRESFHITCLDGSLATGIGPQRYNVLPKLSYRRFTLSLALDGEGHEGGEHRFGEYGDQLYRPETGGALVFSSALLHEIRPVTSGRCFMLLTHFLGDDGTPRPSGEATAEAART